MKKRNSLVLVHFNVYCFHFKRGNQCLQYCVQISTPKSGFLHLTGQSYCKKSRSAKVKDGIINLFLRNYLVGQYTGQKMFVENKHSSLLARNVSDNEFFYNIDTCWPCRCCWSSSCLPQQCQVSQQLSRSTQLSNL